MTDSTRDIHPITDSHCHLDFPDFDGELPDVIARAGWRALKAGKRVEVPGFVTKLVVLSAKITPRGLLARMNGFFWSGRG